jgi:hypothetical protein
MQRSSLVRTALVLSCAGARSSGPLAAQPAPVPRPLCWRAAPKASCSVVILTSFGLYAIGGSRETATGFDPVLGQPTGIVRQVSAGARATGDWGLLFNVGRRDAVGFSLFGSIESRKYGYDSELAAFVRYRRWFGNTRSLDLALGMPVILRNGDALRSPYGLVKFNLNNRLGVALRPEVRRSYVFTTAPPHRASKLFLSAGVEIGEQPGFVLSALGAVILGVRTLILIHNLD